MESWISHIAAFVAGLGTGWVAKVYISSSQKSRTTVVSQKGNLVGGDLVAGDQNKETRG